MKPVLYISTETSFASRGIGTLTDVISCKVTEALNGAYEAELRYPITGVFYDQIKHHRIFLAKPNETDDAQPFIIYRITKPLNGIITVYGEHLRYRMSSIPVKPFDASTVAETLLGIKTNAVETCPFEFWTDKPNSQGTFSLKTPKSMLSILGGTEGSIIDTFGGGDWQFNRWQANLYAHRGADNGVLIRYGKNLTDINQEENIANVITGILPYWVDPSNPSDVVVPNVPVYSNNASSYPYKRTVVMDFSAEFQTKPTVNQLKSKASAYMTANKVDVPDVSIKVSFIAFWQTEEYKDLYGVEHVALGDTVHVEFEKLNITAEARVLKTVYDSVLERYDSIEVGNVRRTSLTKTISKAIANTTNAVNALKENSVSPSMLDTAIENATNLITGGLGGYVVINRNADGEPEEILILTDSKDYTRAQKLWRWNKNGLGFSNTGYEGSYPLALTSDGQIVADRITTGALNAGLITVGILGNQSGNYWNMATGNFNMRGTGSFGTNNGINMNNGQLSINATNIDTGTMSANRILGGILKLGVVGSSNGALEVYRYDNNSGNSIKYARLSGYGFWFGPNLPTATDATTNDYNDAANFRISTSGDVVANSLSAKTKDVSNTDATLSINQEGMLITNSAGHTLFTQPQKSSWADATDNGKFDKEVWFTEEYVLDGETGELTPVYSSYVDKYLPFHPYTSIMVENTAKTFGTSLSMYGLFCDLYNNKQTWGHTAQYTRYGFYLGKSYHPYQLDTKNSWCYAISSNQEGGGGRFVVADGSHKNKLFRTWKYGSVYFYCYETPTPYFGDIGSGIVGNDGLCYINIDAIFKETIGGGDYQVFLQQYGEGSLYVKDRKPDYFVVEGTPNLEFGWELKARQKDGDQLRMDREFGEIQFDETDYEAESALYISQVTVDYSKEANEHIREITEDRRIPA